tara:strand:+ start:188 stop:745 length:558 start_codon:yes stop_codon:yes gene_type:complete
LLEYDTYIFPHFGTFELVKIDSSTVEKVKNFVSNLINVKLLEQHHKKDKGMEYKRWINGYLGECAVEKYINKKFVDFTIGNSNKYHIADMSSLGIKCGIKTVEIGKFPIIFKNPKTPEIIVIKESLYNYYICGVATIDVLNKYQSDDLIVSERLKKRGTKTAFYGFGNLISPIKLKKRFTNEIHS